MFSVLNLQPIRCEGRAAGAKCRQRPAVGSAHGCAGAGTPGRTVWLGTLPSLCPLRVWLCPPPLPQLPQESPKGF